MSRVDSEHKSHGTGPDVDESKTDAAVEATTEGTQENRAPDDREGTHAKLDSQPAASIATGDLGAEEDLAREEAQCRSNGKPVIQRAKKAKRDRSESVDNHESKSGEDFARIGEEGSRKSSENVDLKASPTEAVVDPGQPNFKTLEEEGEPSHHLFWSEDRLGLQSLSAMWPRWVRSALYSVVVILLAVAAFWVGRLAAPSETLIVSQSPKKETDEPSDLDLSGNAPNSIELRDAIDKAWDEAHSAERKMAEDAIWSLLLAPDFTTRRPFVLAPIDEVAIRQYEHLFPALEPDGLTIEPLFGWEEPDGNRFVFYVTTQHNPDGFAVEVHSSGDQHRVHWNRFVQHHHRTFLTFMREKPKSSRPFYVDVRRVHTHNVETGFQFDQYEVSGTNPNQWFTVFADARTPIGKRLRKRVGWGRELLQLELSFTEINGRFLAVITKIIRENWD